MPTYVNSLDLLLNAVGHVSTRSRIWGQNCDTFNLKKEDNFIRIIICLNNSSKSKEILLTHRLYMCPSTTMSSTTH